VLNELDPVGSKAFDGADLGDNPSRDLRPALVSHNDGRAHRQFPMQLHGGSVLVQIRGFGFHREGTHPHILTGEPDRSMEGHSGAAPFRHGTPAGSKDAALIVYVQMMGVTFHM
jgi:hypothetical protein